MQDKFEISKLLKVFQKHPDSRVYHYISSDYNSSFLSKPMHTTLIGGGEIYPMSNKEFVWFWHEDFLLLQGRFVGESEGVQCYIVNRSNLMITSYLWLYREF